MPPLCPAPDPRAREEKETNDVSRIPRYLEHLKTGFTAESVAAARCRACADRALRDGLPQLAERWGRLALAKDALAVLLLEAADQVRGGGADVTIAISEERYENEVLYPKMIREVEPQVAAILKKVVATQQEHLRGLEALREELQASTIDVAAR
jgi:rubrerythrin